MVVDTSPVLTPLNVALLYAVAEILIPIDPCVAALAGVRALAAEAIAQLYEVADKLEELSALLGEEPGEGAS